MALQASISASRAYLIHVPMRSLLLPRKVRKADQKAVIFIRTLNDRLIFKLRHFVLAP